MLDVRHPSQRILARLSRNAISHLGVISQVVPTEHPAWGCGASTMMRAKSATLFDFAHAFIM